MNLEDVEGEEEAGRGQGWAPWGRWLQPSAGAGGSGQ